MQMVKIKKAESIADVKRALKSNQWFMRNAGLIALNSINPDLAFDEAKKQLDDPALVVRSAAVDLLSKHKSQEKGAEVRELLWKELHAKRNKVKSKKYLMRA
jgi:HEAT repeat protein